MGRVGRGAAGVVTVREITISHPTWSTATPSVTAKGGNPCGRGRLRTAPERKTLDQLVGGEGETPGRVPSCSMKSL